MNPALWDARKRGVLFDVGHGGFVDGPGQRVNATQKVVCELTLRDGRVVYDLNGLTKPVWTPERKTKNDKRIGDAR